MSAPGVCVCARTCLRDSRAVFRRVSGIQVLEKLETDESMLVTRSNSIFPWGMRRGWHRRNKLTGLWRGWVRERGSCFMLESDLMAWQVGYPCIFLHSGATGSERNFEKKR